MPRARPPIDPPAPDDDAPQELDASTKAPAEPKRAPARAKGVVRVRKPSEKRVHVRPTAPVPPTLPKRGANRPPRGRLTLGASAYRDRAELHSAKGRQLLLELIAAHRGHRPTLLRRMNDLFGSSKRRPMGEAELDALLARHDLAAEVEARSLERLKLLLQQNRGDLGRVASTLKLSPKELRKDLERRGEWEAFERARDRYRREVFALPISEQAFLLLHRRPHLADLGALAPLEKQLGDTSRGAWEKCRGEAEVGPLPRFVRLLAISEQRAAELAAHFGLTGG
jgi:hypothetical protein